MGAAYAYADGNGNAPNEITLDNLIGRYGVQAVMNRAYLGAGEINRMTVVRRIVDAYHARAQSENAAAWARDNHGDNVLLIRAMKAVDDGE